VLKSRQLRRLWDTYRFPGFRPDPAVVGIFGDPLARVIVLHRRGKKRRAVCVADSNAPGTTEDGDAFAIFPAATLISFWTWNSAGSFAGTAAR
jgi:hypothetical protein